MAELTFNVLWEILNYDLGTGKLFWRERPRKYFKSEGSWKAWNKQYPGKEALNTDDTYKYKQGRIFGKLHLAHKIIWMMCFEKWPDGEIDHIDKDRSNNRLTNLRDVTHLDNMKNLTVFSSNTSGVSGVKFYKALSKWMVTINVNKKRLHLGYYTDFDEALRVRKAAEIIFGYHPNHGRPKSLAA